MIIPEYPEFAALNFDMHSELELPFSKLTDGISEFSFAGLYLFRNTYNYRVSRYDKESYIFSAEKRGERFFLCPWGIPPNKILNELFENHCYLKNMSEAQCHKDRIRLESFGCTVTEDRDNFDYLYSKVDLANLPGKDYHKKRNLAKAFTNLYDADCKAISDDTISDAISVLEKWLTEKATPGDYEAAKEALEKHKELGLSGSIWYVDKAPIAYCLGSSLCQGTMYDVHFEKALGSYKGVYQYLNQEFAKSLPETCEFINREQDLGDEGLRQAKMTYRPVRFVRKYKVKNRKICYDN